MTTIVKRWPLTKNKHKLKLFEDTFQDNRNCVEIIWNDIKNYVNINLCFEILKL